LARNDRLINLSQHFAASRYLSGNAARDYIGLGLFTAAGIEVIWHNYYYSMLPIRSSTFAILIGARC
jgi:hypothetical protein